MTSPSPPMPPAGPPGPPPRSTRRLLVAGVVVLAVGAWLLLDALGLVTPDLGRHWPLFVVLGGLGSLADYFLLSRRPAACGIGVFALGMGTLFYLLSLRWVDFSDMADWAPVVPFVFGLAFLATWLVGKPRDANHLTAAVVGFVLAFLGWGWHLVRSEVLWALALLAVGGFFVWRAVKQGRSRSNGG